MPMCHATQAHCKRNGRDCGKTLRHGCDRQRDGRFEHQPPGFAFEHPKQPDYGCDAERHADQSAPQRIEAALERRVLFRH